MSITVAIRVRPFNQREKDLNTQLCVEMNGPQTKLIDLEDEENSRSYTYDYSFWSHNQFVTNSDGVFLPDSSSSPYVDQQKVFDILGNSILNNAFEGYHCSLFAYGQTGAGKSYSVMGYKPNIGIVPIVCQEIFKRTKDKGDDGITYEVQFGMLEIYNEAAQDLLIDIDKRPGKGMRIRQKAGLGFYAQGQKKVPVRSYAEIEDWMDVGNQNRSIASTQMNATSSRAHTIIMIEFKQIKGSKGEKLEKLSVINLVDLAGSEKVGKTGAKGDRLKEAQNINKSLSMLGLVISTLADIQSGQQGLRVPYRDSTLTKLLANALGGNSKTIMICAISPAYDNFEESLSTLRYADQAKQIQNTAVVNEDPSDKLIRELNKENQELKDQLEKFEKFFGKNMSESNPNYKRFAKMKENLKENEKQIEDKQKTQEQRLEEIHNQSQMKQKVDKNKPHLSIIAEDAQLNGTMSYELLKDEVLIGNRQGIPKPDIQINGIGVRPLHCKILCSGNQLVIQPIVQDFLFLNGEPIKSEQKLSDNDRVIFGTNSTFVVKIPNTQGRDPNITMNMINYEFMVKEWQGYKDKKENERRMEVLKNINQTSEEKYQKLEQEHQIRIKLMKEDMQSQKQEYEATIQKLKSAKQLSTSGVDLMKLSLIQMMNISKVKDKMKAQEKKNENFRHKLELALMRIPHERQRNRLRQLVDEISPKVEQMNIVASDMGRDIRFILKIKEDDPENLKVLVINKEIDTQYHWDLEKTLNRYYVLKDIFTKDLQDQNKKYEMNYNAQGDPFYDEPDAKQIGKCAISLQPFVHFMDTPSEQWLIKHASQDIKGILKVNVFPTDQEGINNMGRQDMYLKDPASLLGKTVYVKICIEEAWLLPGVSDIYVEFNFDGKLYRTQVVQGQHLNPYFCYSAIHHYQKFNQENLDYFLKQKLTFRVYGNFKQGDWEKHQLGFAGKKEKQLEWLVNPVKEIHNDDINLEKVEVSFVSNSSSSSDDSDKEEKKRLKQNKNGKQKKGEFPWGKNLKSSRECGLFFIGMLSGLIFACHAALIGIYRNDYDIFKQNEIDKRYTQETDESVDFWVRNSFMLAFALVLASSLAINFIGYSQGRRIKEFLLLTIVPFVLWVVFSSVWLRTDKDFQNTQFSLVQALDDEGFKLCENAPKNCVMAKTFDRLYTLTIYALIINIPLYIQFLRISLFFLDELAKEKQLNLIKKPKFPILKNKNQSLEPLQGIKTQNRELDNLNIQRMETNQIIQTNRDEQGEQQALTNGNDRQQ